MAYSRLEIREYAKIIGKSPTTLWRWVSEGCNLRDPKSVREWVTKNEIRQTPMERARRRKRDEALKAAANASQPIPTRFSAPGNGETAVELPPAGRRGAAAALERLEHQEEESHRRLQAALSRGNPVEVQAAQEFWLKCSETLRRLDLAVETARREAETQVPLRVACDAMTAASEWLRISVMQFLSSETLGLMALKDVGEFKVYFVTRFRGILELTVKNADQTNSPVPDWAKTRIREAWNLE
jgi:hypothetical protein